MVIALPDLPAKRATAGVQAMQSPCRQRRLLAKLPDQSPAGMRAHPLLCRPVINHSEIKGSRLEFPVLKSRCW